MRVNVADIKLDAGSHKTVALEVAIDSVEMGGQPFQFDRPFTGEAEIWNAGDRLFIRASVSGEALLQCSRCLTAFSLPVEVSLEEEFMEEKAGERAKKDDQDDEEEEDYGRTVSYYTGDEIDLSESVRDNVLLALPMKPLCDEDCEGLCPSCGVNLNEGACSCVETPSVDPRLAGLEKLLRKPDSKS